MSITSQDVQKLRAATGAGMMAAKRALEEAGGDFDKAVEVLRKKSTKLAANKVDRVTSQGLVETYIHGGGTLGVLIEVACETDFVARTDKFRTLAHDLAMQVAALNPQYLTPEDVPAEVVEREKRIYTEQLKAQGKQGPMAEKIIAGKLDKFYQEVCLLKQPFFKDDKRNVGEVITEAIATTGENIKVKRFARFALSGGPTVCSRA
ncbi:MAG: elongation factor Ts [Candidatus Kerfeldbacteria bacterium]|nr:elongation factor Ts [Candidatus Kerfeldbacteria bacterium]